MMFANQYVLAVKANGKILREQDRNVTLPFGTEFELVCKNLNSRRAMVSVSIDGTDVADGRRLIIAPNNSVTLSRYIHNGNLASGNAFRFIERSAAVETHRGVKEDDGIVRAEFFTEKAIGSAGMTVKELADVLDVRAKDVIAFLLLHGIFTTLNQSISVEHVKLVSGGIHQYLADRAHYWPVRQPPPFSPPPRPWNPYPPYPRPYRGPMMWRPAGASGPTGASGGFSGSRPGFGARMSATPMRKQSASRTPSRKLNSFVEQERGPVNDAGITVPGSEVNQQFYDVAGFPLEVNTTVIILNLRGEIAGKKVAKPVTVDLKPICPTCGKKNKGTDKYCFECGTALRII